MIGKELEAWGWSDFFQSTLYTYMRFSNNKNDFKNQYKKTYGKINY